MQSRLLQKICLLQLMLPSVSIHYHTAELRSHMRLFPMDYSFEHVLILTIMTTDPFLERVECQAKGLTIQ